MEAKVRQAVDSDRDIFVDYTVKLSKFNRSNHANESKNDDYESVLNAIQRKAEKTFCNRNEETLILIAELENKPVGYALGRIYEQDETADNGTGLMGLFDELFVDDIARGLGLGQKLLDKTIIWMKEKGINRVKLHAYSWNSNAKKVYERNGFKEYAVSYEKFI
ncbi:GNAT family N-acetyltransferase [Maledivibacter halophilus]|uniref:Acetyltransferases n=1 Tax=Maledivibacter halophilus TaxID=36842 RepID=A0A1T5M242_9FIRM|nr:GNAT family N-acetyltransferase [Maledivibacter halophilus]SKC81909.1 Acetyltransferases [Maledivibacter halophilus]